MSAILGAALSAAGSVASSLMSGSSARSNQKEMAEYNSPVNQVRRLRAAGLNPALAMANGAMDSGNQSSPAPPMPSFDVNTLAQGVRDNIQLRQQKDLNDALINEHNQNALGQSIRNKFEEQNQLVNLMKMKSEAEKTGMETKHIQKLIDYQQKVVDAFDDNNAANLANLRASSNKMYEEALTERANRVLNKLRTDQDIRLSKSQQAVFAQSVRESAARVSEMKKNGKSQRAINHYVMQAERETAKKLGFENSKWFENYENQQANIRSQTAKNNREHVHATVDFFGIPLGSREAVFDVSGDSPEIQVSNYDYIR